MLVGDGLLAEVPALLGPDVRRVALLHPPTMIKTAEQLAHQLSAAGLEPVRIDVPDGEDAKSVAVAERCWSILGNAGFTRSDAVVGLGGGATTDLAGFVAATWLRGVRLVMVPTTLLGMVDAAVGGKTGINTAEGKNLVGCFYEPGGVICDLDALVTLPAADLIAGLAEVIKCGFIADPEILTMIESDHSTALRHDSQMLRELVERAVSVKARVVSADFERAPQPDQRSAGSCSTMVTPSVMRSSVENTSHGGTGTPSVSAWCTPQSWPDWPADSIMKQRSGIERCCRRSDCRHTTRPTHSTSSCTLWRWTRRPAARPCGS